MKKTNGMRFYEPHPEFRHLADSNRWRRYTSLGMKRRKILGAPRRMVTVPPAADYAEILAFFILTLLAIADLSMLATIHSVLRKIHAGYRTLRK